MLACKKPLFSTIDIHQRKVRLLYINPWFNYLRHMAHFCKWKNNRTVDILNLKYSRVWKLQNFSILMSHLENYYPILEFLDFGSELEWCKLSIIDLKLHHILDIWSQWQRNDTKINSSRSDLFWLFKRRLLVISLLTMCLGLVILIRNRFINPIFGCGVKITPFY